MTAMVVRRRQEELSSEPYIAGGGGLMHVASENAASVLEVSVNHHPNLKYNTHRHPSTGKRACVLVNQGMHALETCVAFEGTTAHQQLRIYRPFEPVSGGASPVSVQVPAERLVIVAET